MPLLYTLTDMRILYRIKAFSTYFTEKTLQFLAFRRSVCIFIPFSIFFVLFMQNCNDFSSTKIVIGKDIHFTFMKNRCKIETKHGQTYSKSTAICFYSYAQF